MRSKKQEEEKDEKDCKVWSCLVAWHIVTKDLVTCVFSYNGTMTLP